MLLWQGQAISQVGTQLFQVIAILVIKEVTESASLIGFFMMAYTIPTLMLGPLGGVLADRYSRTRILLLADSFRGVILVVLAAVLWLHAYSHSLLVPLLLIYSVMEGIVGAVWQPVGMAILPDLVSDASLSGANSLMEGSFQICTIAAQAAAGILFRILGIPFLMLIDAVTYFYAAASDSLLRLPPRSQRAPLSSEPKPSFKVELFEAIRYIHARSGMRTVFYTMTFFQLLMAPMIIVFPFYVDRQLHADPQWYGFLLAAAGIGNLIGYAVGGIARAPAEKSGRLVLTATVLMSLLLTSLAAVHNPWVALSLITGIGITSGFNAIRLVTVLQLATPQDVRGRVFGMLMTITQGLAPVAMALTGFVLDLTGRNIAAVYFSCGAAAALLSANIVLRRDCRQFLGGEYSAADVPVAVPGD